MWDQHTVHFNWQQEDQLEVARMHTVHTNHAHNTPCVCSCGEHLQELLGAKAAGLHTCCSFHEKCRVVHLQHIACVAETCVDTCDGGCTRNKPLTQVCQQACWGDAYAQSSTCTAGSNRASLFHLGAGARHMAAPQLSAQWPGVVVAGMVVAGMVVVVVAVGTVAVVPAAAIFAAALAAFLAALAPA